MTKNQTSVKTKVCAHCNKRLPAAAFNKATKSGTGLQSWCRECSRAYNTARNAKLPPRKRNGKRKQSIVVIGKGLYSLLEYVAERHETTVDAFCDSVLRTHVRETILDELIEL